uniref:Odontosis associated phosphoprotein n=1 Tax=Microcebus murinus TaxID=30608 RepID=A0A8C5VZT6_MICMU
MACRHGFSSWVLLCWLLGTVAKGKGFLQELINLHMDKKCSPLLEAHRMTLTLQTARSSHSPLPPSRGVHPSQGHAGLPSSLSHREDPESTLGFQSDLSFLQSAATVFRSSHLTGHEIAFLLTDISPEGDSEEEAHLRKAKEKRNPNLLKQKKPIPQRS